MSSKSPPSPSTIADVPDDPSIEPNVAVTDAIELRIVESEPLPEQADGNDGLSAADDRPASDDSGDQKSQSDANSDSTGKGDQQQTGGGQGGEGTSSSQSGDAGEGSETGKGGGTGENTETTPPSLKAEREPATIPSRVTARQAKGRVTPRAPRAPIRPTQTIPTRIPTTSHRRTVRPQVPPATTRNQPILNQASRPPGTRRATRPAIPTAIRPARRSKAPPMDRANRLAIKMPDRKPSPDGGQSDSANDAPPQHDAEAFERIRDYLEKQQQEQAANRSQPGEKPEQARTSKRTPLIDQGPRATPNRSRATSDANNGKSADQSDPQEGTGGTNDQTAGPNRGNRSRQIRSQSDPIPANPNRAARILRIRHAPKTKAPIQTQTKALLPTPISRRRVKMPPANNPPTRRRATLAKPSSPEKQPTPATAEDLVGSKTPVTNKTLGNLLIRVTPTTNRAKPTGLSRRRVNHPMLPSHPLIANRGQDRKTLAVNRANNPAVSPNLEAIPATRVTPVPIPVDKDQTDQPGDKPPTDPTGKAGKPPPRFAQQHAANAPTSSPARAIPTVPRHLRKERPRKPAVMVPVAVTPSAQPPPAPADLEYTKKATDMVLDYLQETRDKPDTDLLKDLNWTEQDLQRFADRWQKVRDMEKSASPDAANRESVEEALRSLGMRPPSSDAALGKRRPSRCVPRDSRFG